MVERDEYCRVSAPKLYATTQGDHAQAGVLNDRLLGWQTW